MLVFLNNLWAKMKIGKRIEHLLKNSIAALLRAVLEQKPKSPHPPYKRILFLRFDALGDMILSFPVYRATRDALPQAEIDVLCSRKNIILLEGSNLADNLLVAEKNPLNILKLIRNIRSRKYDLMINLVTRPSFTFGLVARLGGPKSVRIAGDQEQFSYFYNRKIDLPPKSDIHMMKRKFLVCKDFLNPEISHADQPWVKYDREIKNQARDLFDQIGKDFGMPTQKIRLAAINLSAGLERREWPLEKNVLFLQQCIKKYQNEIDGWVVFTDPEKPDKARDLTEKVNKLMSPDVVAGGEHPLKYKSVVLPAQQDIRVIMEFLPYLKVLITPDTSIAHAASAMGTPVLVLTIGENITVWDPIGVIHKIVFSDDPFSLETLPVEKVVESFGQLMQSIYR
jgi:ADP-heptose:LPS heptosyltransferase